MLFRDRTLLRVKNLNWSILLLENKPESLKRELETFPKLHIMESFIVKMNKMKILGYAVLLK